MSIGVLLKFKMLQELALRLRYLQFDSAFPLSQIKNVAACRQADTPYI